MAWVACHTNSLQSGVVNEGVRLAFGPVGRLPRVAVDKVLQHNDITIPPGVCYY